MGFSFLFLFYKLIFSMNDKVYINNKMVSALQAENLEVLGMILQEFVSDMRLVEEEALKKALDSHGVCSDDQFLKAAKDGRIEKYLCAEPEFSYKYILDGKIPLITVEPTGDISNNGINPDAIGRDLKFGYRITAYING